MIFIDRDNQIYIQRNIGSEITMSKSQFQILEPGYTLPEGVFVRYFDENLHYFDTKDYGQIAANDIDRSVITQYCKNVEQYRSQLNVLKPVVLEGSQTESWNTLEAGLRGTSAWSKVFMAMASTTRANAAGTLILTAISATHNVNDLRAGFLALLEAMESQSTAPNFSDSELAEIKHQLDINGFDSHSFGLYPSFH